MSNLTYEQIVYLVKLAMVWSYGAFVVWWWVSKVLNPIIALWAECGLWYVLTGSRRFMRYSMSS